VSPPPASRRRPNLWLAVIVTTVACWVVGGLLLWVTGVFPRRAPAAPSRPPVTTTAAPSTPTPDLPPGPEQYRDRHGRFVCRVPAGWQVEEDVGDSRSKVRFFRGQEEIRVIAQPSDQPDLGEADRAAAVAVFRDIARQAGATNLAERELQTAWRELYGLRLLQVDLELDQPGFLWMRQVKFRRAGVDHTIAAYAGSPAAREEVRRVLEGYLAGYQAGDR